MTKIQTIQKFLDEFVTEDLKKEFGVCVDVRVIQIRESDEKMSVILGGPKQTIYMTNEEDWDLTRFISFSDLLHIRYKPAMKYLGKNCDIQYNKTFYNIDVDAYITNPSDFYEFEDMSKVLHIDTGGVYKLTFLGVDPDAGNLRLRLGQYFGTIDEIERSGFWGMLTDQDKIELTKLYGCQEH
jgi:hypothetical protein